MDMSPLHCFESLWNIACYTIYLQSIFQWSIHYTAQNIVFHIGYRMIHIDIVIYNHHIIHKIFPDESGLAHSTCIVLQCRCNVSPNEVLIIVVPWQYMHVHKNSLTCQCPLSIFKVLGLTRRFTYVLRILFWRNSCVC